jgi:hypothetical protein
VFRDLTGVVGPSKDTHFPSIFYQVFEHVESYACNEATPDDPATLKTIVNTVSPESCSRGSQYQALDLNETEDEIQLYFRPPGRKRGQRRGAC